MKKVKKLGETMQKVKKKIGTSVQKYRYIEKKDFGDRLLSFMLDVSVALSPMMLWNIVMLAVLGSLMSFSGVKVVNVIVGVMMIGSIFFLNTIICRKTGGQSLGMYLYDFQLISISGKKANIRQMYMRDLIGFAIPFVVLMLFTSIFGVMAYWLLNGIVVLADKKHRSLIDFLTRTCVVKIVGSTFIAESVKETVKQPSISEAAAQKTVSINSVDLHIHSNFSIGADYNIEEIFQSAKRQGLKTISITDLNTTKSNAIALRMSELYGIRYVNGVEILADLHGHTVHVLGYFVDYQNELYRTIENDALLAEKRASIQRVRLFEQYLGKQIHVDDLLENNRFQQISGEMIARHVLNHPRFQDCEIIKPYLLGKMKNPYHQLATDYFAQGKPCHVNAKHPSLQDVLDVISLSNGIAILANPYPLFEKDENLLILALQMGIEGLEVFRPDYTRKEMATLMQLAIDRKLLITCGSDFYKEGMGRAIGECHCPKEAEPLIDMLLYAKE